MFLSDLPPVLSNYFRPGCNQSVLSSQEEHPSSTTSASCVSARTITRTWLSRITPLPHHAFFFLKLYEPAFRMERRKGLDESTTPILDQSEKTLEGWPRLSATEVVASDEEWWLNEVAKKGVVGFTACPSSRMGSCWRASPEGDAHRDFTRAGRGRYLVPGQ